MQYKAPLILLSTLLGSTIADPLYSGWTTYKQLIEGADNSGQVAYSAPDRSTTLYVNVQILANAGTHTSLFNDLKKLCANYGAKGVSMIPRLRYGTSDGNYGHEPNNATTIKNDVNAFANVLTGLINAGTCQIPIVQAGTLGDYGEWHGGPFCNVSGQASTSAQKAVKLQVVTSLLGTTANVAVRNPQDYAILLPSLNSDQASRFTMHDDCILAEGRTGSDTGTFVDQDGKTAAQWRQYTIDKTAQNGFGGEACPDTYPWDNTTYVCSDGPDGLVAYIKTMSIAYLNPGYPQGLANIYQSKSACATKILNALQAND